MGLRLAVLEFLEESLLPIGLRLFAGLPESLRKAVMGHLTVRIEAGSFPELG